MERSSQTFDNTRQISIPYSQAAGQRLCHSFDNKNQASKYNSNQRQSRIKVDIGGSLDRVYSNSADLTLHQLARAAQAALRLDGTQELEASENALRAVQLSLADITAFLGAHTEHLSEILSKPDTIPQLGELEQEWERYQLAIQAGISSISALSDAATVDMVGASEAKGIQSDWASAFLRGFSKVC